MAQVPPEANQKFLALYFSYDSSHLLSSNTNLLRFFCNSLSLGLFFEGSSKTKAFSKHLSHRCELSQALSHNKQTKEAVIDFIHIVPFIPAAPKGLYQSNHYRQFSFGRIPLATMVLQVCLHTTTQLLHCASAHEDECHSQLEMLEGLDRQSSLPAWKPASTSGLNSQLV